MAQILIVDDDASIRETLQALLERLGHRVRAAEDGVRATQIFDEGTFDLIVSDVMMPEMNGFDLLQTLQSRILDRVPFVILSSHDDREGIKAALFAGAFDYILKPFDEGRVSSVVERALAQRASWAQDGGAPTRQAAVSFTAPPAMAAPPPRHPAPEGTDVLQRSTKVVRVAAPLEQDRVTRGGARRWLGRLLPRRRT